MKMVYSPNSERSLVLLELLMYIETSDEPSPSIVVWTVGPSAVASLAAVLVAVVSAAVVFDGVPVRSIVECLTTRIIDPSSNKALEDDAI